MNPRTLLLILCACLLCRFAVADDATTPVPTPAPQRIPSLQRIEGTILSLDIHAGLAVVDFAPHTPPEPGEKIVFNRGGRVFGASTVLRTEGSMAISRYTPDFLPLRPSDSAWTKRLEGSIELALTENDPILPVPLTNMEAASVIRIPTVTPDANANESTGTIVIPAMTDGYRIRPYVGPSEQERLADIEARHYQLILENAPELMSAFDISSGPDEVITRAYGGLWLPMGERASLTALCTVQHFELERAAQDKLKTDLVSLELRGGYQIDKGWQAWASLMPYFRGHDGGVSLKLGAQYENPRGFFMNLRGEIFDPWVDNSEEAALDGVRHGLNLQTMLPLFERLNVYTEADAALYRLLDAPPTGSQDAGERIQSITRANLILLRAPGRELTPGFLDATTGEPAGLSSLVQAYASFTYARHWTPEDFVAVAVTRESTDLRFGLDASWVMTNHLGFSTGAYIGHDPEREVAFGQLWGTRARIVWIPTGRLRLWAEGALDNDRSQGISEGLTKRIAVGANIKF